MAIDLLPSEPCPGCGTRTLPQPTPEAHGAAIIAAQRLDTDPNAQGATAVLRITGAGAAIPCPHGQWWHWNTVNEITGSVGDSTTQEVFDALKEDVSGHINAVEARVGRRPLVLGVAAVLLETGQVACQTVVVPEGHLGVEGVAA